eukprot:1159883-Pelagomonas_calceolata.AAC.4
MLLFVRHRGGRRGRQLPPNHPLCPCPFPNFYPCTAQTGVGKGLSGRHQGEYRGGQGVYLFSRLIRTTKSKLANNPKEFETASFSKLAKRLNLLHIALPPSVKGESTCMQTKY